MIPTIPRDFGRAEAEEIPGAIASSGDVTAAGASVPGASAIAGSEDTVRGAPGPGNSCRTVDAPESDVRVMVVDDEGPVRRAVARMVASQGFIVSVARDAEEALRMLGEAPVDVLLTDIVMPGMSGIRLAEAARARCPRLAVVFMSGYAHDVLRESGVEQGEISYLQKPFTLPALTSRLVQAIAGGRVSVSSV